MSEPVKKMFSRPLRFGCRPARNSISAPTRPATVTDPAVGSITRARIFSMVDFPDPFAPTMPSDDPGSIARSTLRNTHRQPRLE